VTDSVVPREPAVGHFHQRGALAARWPSRVLIWSSCQLRPCLAIVTVFACSSFSYVLLVLPLQGHTDEIQFE
jgi:hypothetical protein